MAGLDREKSLDVALAQIEKAYGKGTVMRLGDEVAVPMRVIPTGSIALDLALGVGGLPRGRVVEIYGPESSGKCLTADTYLWTDHGLETVAELFARCGQPASCTSRTTDISHLGVRVVNERGELEPISHLTHNNRRPVRSVHLASGRQITATLNHPLRVINERGFIVWRKVGRLEAGDVLVSAEFGAVEAAQGDGLDEDMAVLLGYLIAEGSNGGKHAVRFTNQDPYVSAEFTTLMSGLFGSVVKLYGGQEHCVFDMALRRRLADEFGLAYVNAPEKTVPHCVRTGGHKIQRAFLSALFEGDGWIDTSSTVGLGTASEQLAREVQFMLFGLGVPASVYRKFNQVYQRHYWSVVVNPTAASRFLDEVGFRSPRRAEQVARCLRQSRLDPQLENVPHVTTLLGDLRDALGGDRAFDRVAGDLFRAGGDLACSRSRLRKLVVWLDGRNATANPACLAITEYLRMLSEARFTYERVARVEEAGLQPTFDLVVPGTHSFLANGVLSHNTTVALHAVAQAQAAGGIAAFIDAEHALDPDYARALGVDTDALLVSQPDTGEQALEIMDMLIRSGALDVIVVDSVAALVPRAEIEGEMGDSHVGLQARLMSQALRKITGALSNSGTTAIFINQLREKIGVLFGSPETTTGGKALKFYASIRLDVRRIETLKDGGDAVGNRTRVKVVKNKCLAEGSLIFDPVTGQTHRIEDIVDERRQVSVVAAAKDNTLHIRPAVSWFDQGEQDVIGLRIEGGGPIWVTPDHQMLTDRGWLPAGDLIVGDRLARPRRFLGFGDQFPIPAEHARLLGYLIGDGYVGGKTPVTFINTEQSLHEDVARIADGLGCTAKPQGPLSVALSHRVGENNGVLALCRAAGIYGGLAWQKSVPAYFFAPETAAEVVGNVLFGLLETDGYVSREQTGGVRVGFTTTSEQLAQQVHWLLLRFGVGSTVRAYDPSQRRPSLIQGRRIQHRRPVYEVRIAGSDNVEAFAAAIPNWGPRGQLLRRALDESQAGRRRGSQAVYLAPTATQPVLGRLRDAGVSPGQAAQLIGPTAGDPRGGMKQVLGASRLRRDRLLLLADALDDSFLHQVLADDIRHSAIREILPARRARTFDIEVDELHTFVANDVVLHNCAPPFKQAEFDIVYGRGISREGSLIDVGVEQGIVRKSGAWYTYEGDQLGQGKENVRAFLRDNPDLADEIEKKLKEKLGIGPKLDADTMTPVTAPTPAPAPVDF